MVDSPPENPNGLSGEDKKSSSSSAEPERISIKDRKHRKDVNDCVDALKRYFQTVTAVELPKRNRCWDVVTRLVWGKIFEARERSKLQKASMKLEECAETAKQIVKSARDAIEDAKIKLAKLEPLMELLQQRFLDEDSDPYLVKYKGDVDIGGLEDKLAMLIYGFEAEAEKLYGDPVKLKFSIPSSQQPDSNNNRNKIHRISKKQGHLALKVFFYTRTKIVLPKVWKEAKDLVKEKIRDAEVEKKLNDKRAPPDGAATLDRMINSTRAACEEAKKLVNDCKCWFQLVGPLFRHLFYPICHIQHGVNSEVVIPHMGNEMVPGAGGMQNLPVSTDLAQTLDVAAPLESLEATGSSSKANSRVAHEPDGDDEHWLMEISNVFPEIKDGGFFELLLEMAKGVPQRFELNNSNQELESMDLRVSKLEQEVDNTCEALGALQQKKRKLNQC